MTSNTSVGTDKEKAFPRRDITCTGSLLAKWWQFCTQKAWGLCYNHETTSYSKQLCSLPVLLNNKFFIATNRELATPETMSIKHGNTSSQHLHEISMLIKSVKGFIHYEKRQKFSRILYYVGNSSDRKTCTGEQKLMNVTQ